MTRFFDYKVRKNDIGYHTQFMAAYSKRLQKLLRDAIAVETDKIAEQSQKLVPVSDPRLPYTEYLKESMQKRVKKVGSSGYVGVITYHASYAAYVHEIPPPPKKSPKGRSARHAPPTRWKYLEIPVNRSRRWYAHNIQKYISSRL